MSEKKNCLWCWTPLHFLQGFLGSWEKYSSLLFLKCSFAFQRERTISRPLSLPHTEGRGHHGQWWVRKAWSQVTQGWAALPTPPSKAVASPKGLEELPLLHRVSACKLWPAAVRLIKCSHSFPELLICVSALLLRKGAAASLVAFCYRKEKKTVTPLQHRHDSKCWSFQDTSFSHQE